MQPNRTITRIGSYVLALRAWAEHRSNQKNRGFWVRRVRNGQPELQAPIIEDPGQTDKREGEVKKGEAKSQEKALEKLEGMVEKSQNVLIQSRALFPFDLFPDSIVIDRKKITLTHRSFFGVQQTISVRHSDVTNVQADVGPFLGSLTITSEHFINNIQTIKFLSRKDAVAIQRLIQGMIIAHKEAVEMNDIDDDKLMDLLNELGETSR